MYTEPERAASGAADLLAELGAHVPVLYDEKDGSGGDQEKLAVPERPDGHDGHVPGGGDEADGRGSARPVAPACRRIFRRSSGSGKRASPSWARWSWPIRRQGGRARHHRDERKDHDDFPRRGDHGGGLSGSICRRQYRKCLHGEALKTTDTRPWSAEISSFQLETIHEFRPHVSAILNITEDHLNRHHTMEEYIRVKELITCNQTKEDVCVLNHEDPVLRAFGETSCPARVFWFSSAEGAGRGIFLRDGDGS